MSALELAAVWQPEIYQLETTDPVEAGPGGIDNLQAKQLGDRTEYLKSLLEFGDAGPFTVPAAADPALNVVTFDTPVDAFYHVGLEFIRPVGGGAMISVWETLFVFGGTSTSSESIKVAESLPLALDVIVASGVDNKPVLQVKMASGAAVTDVRLRWRVKRIVEP